MWLALTCDGIQTWGREHRRWCRRCQYGCRWQYCPKRPLHPCTDTDSSLLKAITAMMRNILMMEKKVRFKQISIWHRVICYMWLIFPGFCILLTVYHSLKSKVWHFQCKSVLIAAKIILKRYWSCTWVYSGFCPGIIWRKIPTSCIPNLKYENDQPFLPLHIQQCPRQPVCLILEFGVTNEYFLPTNSHQRIELVVLVWPIYNLTIFCIYF